VPPAVAIIVNPIAGVRSPIGRTRERAEQAAALAAAHGLDVEVFVTERRGHARELAAAALNRGVTRVLAWGGDGTVNEVASALAFREAALGVIPAGSGNGLARELGIPLTADGAFAAAVHARPFRIDAGELDGRLFANVAGIGLDAHVAHQFASLHRARRGLRRYIRIVAGSLFTYQPVSYTVVTDGVSMQVEALIAAIANGRQYGNGAQIAPSAKLDDGLLDVVTIRARSPLATVLQIPRLMTGRIAHVPGVTIRPAAVVEVTADQALPYHVDGEPFVGGTTLRARVRPGALQVLAPSEWSGGSR
jgi:YegS/Rv2252/BmrU family lipid kinase